MKAIYFLLLFIPHTLTLSIDIRYPQFFHQSTYDSSIEITEGKSIGSFIAFINLIDDTKIILDEWQLNTTNSDFKVQFNGISYSLITTKVLDRERISFYNFSINAQRLIPPYQFVSRTILIRILDLNDCTPRFNLTKYYTELIPKETNFTVQAFDDDEPNTSNSRISYSLSNYQDVFRINETTGLIECIQNLNTFDTYEIIVNASDHGKPSLSSTVVVRIQLLVPLNAKTKGFSWLNIEPNTETMILLTIILACCFVFMCLLLCLLYCIKYKIQRPRVQDPMKDKKFSSTSTINSSNDFQQAAVYDAVNIFPNTYYLPVQQSTDRAENLNNSNNHEISLDIQHSLSTTSSPISTNDLGLKVSSDDGCYCSSDMSSEQSNNLLLLNPSSLTLITNSRLSSKQVRFTEKNQQNIDGVLKRFENLYGSRANTDHRASYV